VKRNGVPREGEERLGTGEKGSKVSINETENVTGTALTSKTIRDKRLVLS